MGNMSGMMGDMGQMMGSGKMTPEEMQNMSKMMGDMSGMMKQMSERMKKGNGKDQVAMKIIRARFTLSIGPRKGTL